MLCPLSPFPGVVFWICNGGSFLLTKRRGWRSFLEYKVVIVVGEKRRFRIGFLRCRFRTAEVLGVWLVLEVDTHKDYLTVDGV